MTRTERYRSARRDPDLAVLEGLHALKHALRFEANIIEATSPDPARLATLARALAPDVAARIATLVEPVSHAEFAALAPRAPGSGVLALARRKAWTVADALGTPGDAPVILLDDPHHAGNTGAVVRVAAAADAAGVLTTGEHDPWRPGALRGAAGLHYALPVARIEQSTARLTDLARTARRPLVALVPAPQIVHAGEARAERNTPGPESTPASGAVPGPDRETEEGDVALLTPGVIPPRALLMFGSERQGLSAALLARAAHKVAIPMRPGVSSLNLATAVAVALYTR